MSLALAGCGGIPMSGSVAAGPALGEIEPDYEVQPQEPQPGATPQQILAGFMQAVGAPQNGYRVAREFLTPDLAARWHPETGVSVRSGDATVSEASDTTDTTPRLDYAFSGAASVDGAGRYRETGPTTHSIPFAFAKTDDGWRISEAPEGIVLSQIAFVRAFTALPLYFFDTSGRYLVPDVRWFASSGSTAQAAAAALVAGPDEWLAPAVVTQFPSGTTLGSGGAKVTAGRASVDLSAQAAAASPDALARMRQQLAATLAPLGVNEVSVTASGVPLGRGGDVNEPARDPQPSGAVLVGTGTDFGFGAAAGVMPIDGISSVIVAEEATAVTLAHDQVSAAYLAGDGTVKLVVKGDAVGRVIDSRPGLLAPTLDPAGFVWSATGSAIEAFTPDGKAVGLDVEDVPADGRIASIAMSRDGTRLAVLLSSGAGSRLFVFAVARQNSVPTQLRSPLELPVPGGAPGGVAWVDDQTLVTATGGTDASSGSRVVRLIPIGSPSDDLGLIGGDGVVVGGLGGRIGIRALAGGKVLAANSTSTLGWSDTGIAATFLGVQQ